MFSNWRNRFFVLFMAIGLAVTLSACGSSSSGSGTTTTTPSSGGGTVSGSGN